MGSARRRDEKIFFDVQAQTRLGSPDDAGPLKQEKCVSAASYQHLTTLGPICCFGGVTRVKVGPPSWHRQAGGDRPPPRRCHAQPLHGTWSTRTACVGQGGRSPALAVRHEQRSATVKCFAAARATHCGRACCKRHPHTKLAVQSSVEGSEGRNPLAQGLPRPGPGSPRRLAAPLHFSRPRALEPGPAPASSSGRSPHRSRLDNRERARGCGATAMTPSGPRPPAPHSR